VSFKAHHHGGIRCLAGHSGYRCRLQETKGYSLAGFRANSFFGASDRGRKAYQCEYLTHRAAPGREYDDNCRASTRHLRMRLWSRRPSRKVFSLYHKGRTTMLDQASRLRIERLQHKDVPSVRRMMETQTTGHDCWLDGGSATTHALNATQPERQGRRVARVFTVSLTISLAGFSACHATPELGDPRERSADETLIRAARTRSNQAIAAHDTIALASAWLPDFWLVSSTNAQSAGRAAARARYAQLFASRPDVIYVREPGRIEVNASWGQAAESGQWTGRWTQSDGVTLVGGRYFAKWRKVDGRWLLLAEVFVQTSCSGSAYCNSPPPS
jgi:ketosteroid isomerase-like protein